MSWLTAWLAPYKLAALAVLAGAAVLLIGGQYVTIVRLRADLAQERASRATDRADADRAYAAAQVRARAESDRRAADLQEIVDDAQTRAAQSRADADAAGAALGRMRQHVAALVAAAGGSASNPAAAEGGPSAADAARVLADMQRRTGEAAGLYARLADERGDAGTVCERAYDALTPRVRLGEPL